MVDVLLLESENIKSAIQEICLKKLKDFVSHLKFIRDIPALKISDKTSVEALDMVKLFIPPALEQDFKSATNKIKKVLESRIKFCEDLQEELFEWFGDIKDYKVEIQKMKTALEKGTISFFASEYYKASPNMKGISIDLKAVGDISCYRHTEPQFCFRLSKANIEKDIFILSLNYVCDNCSLILRHIITNNLVAQGFRRSGNLKTAIKLDQMTFMRSTVPRTKHGEIAARLRSRLN